MMMMMMMMMILMMNISGQNENETDPEDLSLHNCRFEKAWEGWMVLSLQWVVSLKSMISSGTVKLLYWYCLLLVEKNKWCFLWQGVVLLIFPTVRWYWYRYCDTEMILISIASSIRWYWYWYCQQWDDIYIDIIVNEQTGLAIKKKTEIFNKM